MIGIALRRSHGNGTLTRSLALLLMAGLGVSGAQPDSVRAQSERRETARVRIDAKELEAFVDGVIAAEMEREHLPGVAFALVHEGQVVLAKGYGVADVETGRKVTPEGTIFRIGSITKVVTAMALVQAADRKGIGLDTDVNSVLTGIEVDGRYREPVRLRHLLTHTGGFDQIGRDRQAPDPSSRVSIEQFLRKNLIRIRPPGQVSAYDTYGITLAGYLISAISKMPYAEYLKKRVFEPLGMSRSFVEVPPEHRDDLATGYGYVDGKYVPQRYEYYVTTPASSIDATAADMARFMIAVLAGARRRPSPLLSAKAAAGLDRPQFANAPGFPAFTYGFWEEVRNGERTIHHGGTMLGFTSEMYLVPEHDLGFYVVTNRDSEAGGGPVRLREILIEQLMDRWFPVAPPKPPGPFLEVGTERFAGNYANNLYCHTCLEGDGWIMYFTPVRSPEKGVLEIGGERFRAVAPLVFAAESNGRRIAFREDERGRVSHLITSHNMVLERLGDRLLDEVLGAGWQKRPPAPLVPLVYRANEEWEKAARAFASLAERYPRNGRTHYNEGHAWLKAGEPKRAIAPLMRAWDLEARRPFTGYRLATAHALLGDRDRAIEWLGRAIDAGFAERDMLEEDPNLESIRDDPRFPDLVKRVP